MAEVSSPDPVDFHVFGSSDYHKVAWRIILYVPVYMVDVFAGFEFSFKKTLHDNSVFRFVMSLSNHNVFVSIFNIFTRKNLRSDWLTISSHKGVVVSAKPLGKSFESASVHGTHREGGSVYAFHYGCVSVSKPSLIVKPAKFLRGKIGSLAPFNCAFLQGGSPFLDKYISSIGMLSMEESHG